MEAAWINLYEMWVVYTMGEQKFNSRVYKLYIYIASCIQPVDIFGYTQFNLLRCGISRLVILHSLSLYVAAGNSTTAEFSSIVLSLFQFFFLYILTFAGCVYLYYTCILSLYIY